MQHTRSHAHLPLGMESDHTGNHSLRSAGFTHYPPDFYRKNQNKTQQKPQLWRQVLCIPGWSQTWDPPDLRLQECITMPYLQDILGYFHFLQECLGLWEMLLTSDSGGLDSTALLVICCCDFPVCKENILKHSRISNFHWMKCPENL